MLEFTLLAGLWLAQSDPATMPADSWMSVPNTKMSAVTPTEGQFPGTWGVIGPSGVIAAWSGGALDTKRSRLILFGGGHADYGGNELYAFSVGTMTWERMTNPTVNPASDDSDQNPDGTPQSRHSYGGLAYLAHADRFFALGGSIFTSGHGACSKVWTYDLTAKSWTRDASAAPFSPGYDACCAYDPATKKLWFCQMDSGNWAHVWGYDFDSKTWTNLPIGDLLGFGGCALDTKRGLLVATTGGTVMAFDVRGNGPAQTWTTTGGSEFLSQGEVGFDYDSASDKLVGWASDKVFVLDPETKAWTVHNPPGAPAPSGNGTYGRWRYVPSVNAFILVTGINVDVHFYKLGDGPAAPTITAPPGDQSVIEGQAATFSVTAAGTGPLMYQWQRNGADLPGATGASYITPAAVLGDSGATFRVIVTNASGSATSPAATLTVQPSSGGGGGHPRSGGGGDGRCGAGGGCGATGLEVFFFAGFAMMCSCIGRWRRAGR